MGSHLAVITQDTYLPNTSNSDTDKRRMAALQLLYLGKRALPVFRIPNFPPYGIFS